jgi:hypothetical protein
MTRGRPVGPLARAFALAAVMVVRPATGRAQAPAQNAPPAPPPTFKVEVIETTPLPGLDLKLEQIPAPMQAAVSADVEASGALDLSDFLNRRFTGVFVNEMSGNPFQADLNYRGYTASPVLGTPQGLSIYMDSRPPASTSRERCRRSRVSSRSSKPPSMRPARRRPIGWGRESSSEGVRRSVYFRGASWFTGPCRSRTPVAVPLASS